MASSTAWYVVKERRRSDLYELYFNGQTWDMARHDALKYSTKEEAESVAFLLAVKHGEDMGKVSVKEMAWEPDGDE